MNLTSIFVLAVVALILGIYLLGRSRLQSDLRGLKTSGMLLVSLGTIGVVWVVVALVLFVFNA